jgi:TRAP-type C4-dicarboxylate transport system substrate-binding protein
MNRTRTRVTILAPAIALLLAACQGTAGGAPPASDAPSAPGTGTSGPVAISDPPVTLRLAVADASGRPSQTVVDDLVKRVATLSGGNITIVPTFEAGGPKFELGTIELLGRADADLAIVASRAWDLAGETGLQALQAPFLIDNDALADAVAGGDIGRLALDAMDTAVGLSMWPEDLRHPVAFERCGKDFRTPAGLAGATFLVQPSALGQRVFGQLGTTAYPHVGVDRNIDAHSCELHGMEVGLSNLQAVPMGEAPLLLADVTVFPKYQVLAANRASFDRLGAVQQAVLREAAAAAAAAALEARQHEPALAAAWCDAGGAIDLAGPDAQAAFREATAPVLAELEQDPAIKSQIEAITALKAATPASPGAEPCESRAIPTPVPIGSIDTTGYVGTTFPNGTFRRELIAQDLIAAGLDAEIARNNEQVLTYSFDDGRVTFRWESQGRSGGCEGTYESRGGKYVEMTTVSGDADCGVGPNSVWREEPDGISFVSLDPNFLPSDHILIDHWVWTRIK